MNRLFVYLIVAVVFGGLNGWFWSVLLPYPQFLFVIFPTAVALGWFTPSLVDKMLDG